MHSHRVDHLAHDHVFLSIAHRRNEGRLWLVVFITAVMMIAEIVAGSWFNSLALLADGWHMATHAGALAISAFAYWYARQHVGDRRFTFGTGKVGELAAYTSAFILGAIAIFIGWESFERFQTPLIIAFNQAILIAGIGLGVNLVCVLLLWSPQNSNFAVHHNHGHHKHNHAHQHSHSHQHSHAVNQSGIEAQDRNMHAAFIHVIGDALTSVLAIAALAIGKFYGLTWLDPVVGFLGAVIIAKWSWGLLRTTSRVLLDAEADHALSEKIRTTIETGSADKVTDLHLWRVGPHHFAATVSIVTDRALGAANYRKLLEQLEGLVHVTVEIHPCTENCGLAKTV